MEDLKEENGGVKSYSEKERELVGLDNFCGCSHSTPCKNEANEIIAFTITLQDMQKRNFHAIPNVYATREVTHAQYQP